MAELHRSWGKAKLYYCPKNKTVWQYDTKYNIHIHKDMPSYGLDRKELPR
mgnify:CR=1 FL=1